MAIDDRCNPNKNPRFADMLDRVGFDYKNARIRSFTNPKTDVVSGAFLLKGKDDLVLVLLPGLGTSVLEHKEEKEETVHYLGAIEGTGGPPLYYKFQDSPDEIRIEETYDIVRQYSPGDSFTTMREGINGRWRGYHNPDPEYPIALRIKKKF